MHARYLLFACALATLTLTNAYAAVEVKTTRIAHGVRAWYAESNQVPVVDIQITFEGAGYVSDPAGKEGRAALAAAMLTQGAGNLDALAFQRALDDSALDLTAGISADRLTIHLHALRDQAARGGELLAMALTQPQFTATDLARVKNIQLAHLAQRKESPGYQAERLFDTHAFASHPYANPPLGNPESLATITSGDLKDYLTTYATRGNVMIAASGDVDARLLDTILTPVVDALRDGDAAPPISAITMHEQGQQLRQSMDVPQTVVEFATPSVARDDPKFYAAYLLNHILGGDGLVSRLALQLRQQKGLVYSINTDIDIRRGIALLRGEFATRNASADEAVTELKRVLTDIHDKGITTEECASAKTYVIGSNALRLDSTEQITGMLLSMQINHLGEDYLDKREGYFNSVTCADINAIAHEWLDPEKFLIVMVGGDGPAKP